MSRIHIYQAKIVEVIDGDTFDLMIDTCSQVSSPRQWCLLFEHCSKSPAK